MNQEDNIQQDEFDDLKYYQQDIDDLQFLNKNKLQNYSQLFPSNDTLNPLLTNTNVQQDGKIQEQDFISNHSSNSEKQNQFQQDYYNKSRIITMETGKKYPKQNQLTSSNLSPMFDLSMQELHQQYLRNNTVNHEIEQDDLSKDISTISLKRSQDLDHEINNYRQRLTTLECESNVNPHQIFTHKMNVSQTNRVQLNKLQNDQSNSSSNSVKAQTTVGNETRISQKVNESCNSWKDDRNIIEKLKKMEDFYLKKTQILEERIENLESENKNINKERSQLLNHNQKLNDSLTQQKTQFLIELKNALKDQEQRLNKEFQLTLRQVTAQSIAGTNRTNASITNFLTTNEDNGCGNPPQNQKFNQTTSEYTNKLDQLCKDKDNLLRELENMKSNKRDLEEEKNNLSVSYNNLLNLHNQMLQFDIQKNERNLMKNSGIINTSGQINTSLSQQLQQNHQIQQQMINQQNLSSTSNRFFHNDEPQEDEKKVFMELINNYRSEIDNYKQRQQASSNQLLQEVIQLKNELERTKKQNRQLLDEVNQMKSFCTVSMENSKKFEEEYDQKQQQQNLTGKVHLKGENSNSICHQGQKGNKYYFGNIVDNKKDIKQEKQQQQKYINCISETLPQTRQYTTSHGTKGISKTEKTELGEDTTGQSQTANGSKAGLSRSKSMISRGNNSESKRNKCNDKHISEQKNKSISKEKTKEGGRSNNNKSTLQQRIDVKENNRDLSNIQNTRSQKQREVVSKNAFIKKQQKNGINTSNNQGQKLTPNKRQVVITQVSKNNKNN